MPDEKETGNKKYEKQKQRPISFEQVCCEYMEKFGFEWVEEFTLNGA